MQPTLRLYNTLTRTKEVFTPVDPLNVRMYVCGPTVYDFAHIGNARPVIVFDVLFRLLRHLYGEAHVKYVRNITDVDDKINARAAREHPELALNEAIRRVTTLTEQQFHEDVAALGCLPPTVSRARRTTSKRCGRSSSASSRAATPMWPRSHVLFDVASMPGYGRLARRSLDEMLAGARVDVAPYKKGPMDFVLWKPSKAGMSPAGRALPASRLPAAPAGTSSARRCRWRNCSRRMAAGCTCDDPLKNTFDIHGGGIDLVFPHHENEIAQSCCASARRRWPRRGCTTAS
jgi:cysteinyl-tRNA synthetase